MTKAIKGSPASDDESASVNWYALQKFAGPLTPEQQTAAINFHLPPEQGGQGKTVTEIARILGVRQQTISKFLARRGLLQPGARAPINLSDDEIRDLLDQNRRGVSLRDLARRLGVTHTGLARYLRHHNFSYMPRIDSNRSPATRGKRRDRINKLWAERGGFWEWVVSLPVAEGEREVVRLARHFANKEHHDQRERDRMVHAFLQKYHLLLERRPSVRDGIRPPNDQHSEGTPEPPSSTNI